MNENYYKINEKQASAGFVTRILGAFFEYCLPEIGSIQFYIVICLYFYGFALIYKNACILFRDIMGVKSEENDLDQMILNRIKERRPERHIQAQELLDKYYK